MINILSRLEDITIGVQRLLHCIVGIDAEALVLCMLDGRDKIKVRDLHDVRNDDSCRSLIAGFAAYHHFANAPCLGFDIVEMAVDRSVDIGELCNEALIVKHIDDEGMKSEFLCQADHGWFRGHLARSPMSHCDYHGDSSRL